MARAVDVRVVAVRRLVLDVRGVDRDAARLLFGRRVNLVVALRLTTKLLRQHRRDRRRQRRLAMVHVTNRAHVHVRLGPLKLCPFAMMTSRLVSIFVLAERCSRYLALVLMMASATFFGASA